MTYEKRPPLEAKAYFPRSVCQSDEYIHIDFELPCDVLLPPNTTIRAGCKLAVLISALEVEGRPQHFASNGAA